MRKTSLRQWPGVESGVINGHRQHKGHQAPMHACSQLCRQITGIEFFPLKEQPWVSIPGSPRAYLLAQGPLPTPWELFLCLLGTACSFLFIFFTHKHMKAASVSSTMLPGSFLFHIRGSGMRVGELELKENKISEDGRPTKKEK